MALGAEQLLAVHYPSEYGGRDGTAEEYAVVAEAIGLRQFADEVHLVTIQGVGCTILRYGSPEQRERWLPGMASGQLQASLLLSEKGAGSDAAAITTTARRTAGGWSLSGEKCWSLHADWSGLGLVSARTSQGGNRYAGITLFLVDLTVAGVTVRPTRRAMGEPYFVVGFDQVELDESAVLGAVDRGFALVTAAAGFERAGFDYLTRGRLWLRAAEETLTAVPGLDTARRRAAAARLDYELAGARALAQETVATAKGLDLDYLLSAYAKYTCGEAAQAVAHWIGEDILPEPAVQTRPDLVTRLRAAVLEGPELSISGNAVDLLLDSLSMDPQLGEAVPAAVLRTRSAAEQAADAGDHHLFTCAVDCLSAAEHALVLARRRAGSRTVAGRPLIEMQSTGHRIARVAARVAVARVSLDRARQAQDTAGEAGSGYRVTAAAAGAAEAAFAASYALVQVFGAAGTGDPRAIDAFEACQVAGSAAGPPAELWLQAAGRRRLQDADPALVG